jgi:hypothetical protein
MGNAASAGDSFGFRVLGVREDSPGHAASLVSFFDFIVEANGMKLVRRARSIPPQHSSRCLASFHHLLLARAFSRRCALCARVSRAVLIDRLLYLR